MKIAVPFDYTEVSINALRYAVSKFTEDEIHVVHIHSGLNTNNPLTMQVMVPTAEAIRKELEDLILVDQEWETLPSRIHIEVIQGGVVAQLTKYIDKGGFDAMVMGTRDKYDVIDRWIGTLSLAVVKKVEIPIYLIPRYAVFQPYEKVMIASDHHLRDATLVDKLKSWNTDNAYLKFLHVVTSRRDSFREDSQFLFENLFKGGEPTFTFEIAMIEHSSVSDSILAQAYNFKADLLIIHPTKQTFLQTILLKNLSKKIIIKSSIPMLFIK